MKVLPKARRHPVGVALGSQDVALNRVPCELGNTFIISIWVFQSVTTDIHHDWPLEEIFCLALVNYNATNCDISAPF